MTRFTSTDIANLFRKFSGDPEQYQEIKQAHVAETAQQSWPIVEAIRKEQGVSPALKLAESPIGHRVPEERATCQTPGQPHKWIIRPAPPPSLGEIFNKQSQPRLTTPVAAQAGVSRVPCFATPPAEATLPKKRLFPFVSRSVNRQFSGLQSELVSDELSSVFARLEHAASPKVESPSSKGLRGMLKFLTKP